MRQLSIAITIALTIAANVNAQTVVTTDFSVLDGFTIGGTDDVVLDELVTFSGGQQQLSFLGAAYNSGPDGFYSLMVLTASTAPHRPATLAIFFLVEEEQLLFPSTLRTSPMVMRLHLHLLMQMETNFRVC